MSSQLQHVLGKMVLKADTDYMAEIGNLESKAYLAPATELRQELKDFQRYKPNGVGLPFAGRSLVKFFPKRWTLWSGVTHSGKTQFVRFLMSHAIKEGEKVLFASLEEEPVELLMEFACMMLATRDLTDDRIDVALDWLDEKLFLFNHTGFIDPDVAVGAAIYAAREHGVTHVVIDSLMMLDIRKDDYERQKELGALLNRVCRQYNLHIHIIVHPRKGGSSQDAMDLYDIQGAQELVALAHSICTLGRAPKSPKKREEWGITGPETDAILKVWKQRGQWNFTGTMEMSYLPVTRQWALSRSHGPRRFLPSDALYPELGIDLLGQENPYDDAQCAKQFGFL
jgi:KaiC/GvpD/RAD55 family RecA-like ATPase